MNTQPYLPPAPRTVKGIHRSVWGVSQLHGNQRWFLHLTSPGISFRLPPRGATAHRDSPGCTLGLWLGRSIIVPHCGSSPCRVPPGSSRTSFSLPPIGRSWRDFWIGFGSSPRSGNGLDEVRMRLSRFAAAPGCDSIVAYFSAEQESLVDALTMPL